MSSYILWKDIPSRHGEDLRILMKEFPFAHRGELTTINRQLFQRTSRDERELESKQREER